MSASLTGRRGGRRHARGDPSSPRGDGAGGRCVASPRHTHAPPCFRGLHRLGVDDGGGGVRVTAHGSAHAGAALTMKTPPGAVLPPGAPGLLGGLPMRQIVRH
jgi:hypothetical protein